MARHGALLPLVAVVAALLAAGVLGQAPAAAGAPLRWQLPVVVGDAAMLPRGSPAGTKAAPAQPSVPARAASYHAKHHAKHRGFLAGATVDGAFRVTSNGPAGPNFYDPAVLALYPANVATLPGTGNAATNSSNNVPILDSWVEFALQQPYAAALLSTDITTRGLVSMRMSANATAEGLAAWTVTLQSAAFRGCRLAGPISDDFPTPVTHNISSGGMVMLSSSNWTNPNFGTSGFSFEASYQLICRENRACYDDDGLPADGRVCALDPEQHKRDGAYGYFVDESPLTRRTLDSEAEVDALLASTAGHASKHAHCVGRCHDGICTVLHQTKHCCRAPRDETRYDEYSAAALQGGNTHKRTDDTWHCWDE